MEIVKNAYVTMEGAYYESGGIISGTQRIPTNHPMSYWQQGNEETRLAFKKDDLYLLDNIKDALYVGRIPTHFGHFLLEGLPRLCDAAIMNMPIVGYVTDGFLPEGIKATPRESINWVIKTITSEMFYELDGRTEFIVENLLVPELPMVLSCSCSEPWRMSAMIKKIVKAARSENKKIRKSNKLFLSKKNEEYEGFHDFSNPDDHISKQIAKVSYAKSLHGVTGSNTHISMFAQKNCLTSWEQRGDFDQTDRNQLICDLVKTYNNF